MIIGITGTAGVGKSLFAGKVARDFSGISVIELNDIAKKYDLFFGSDKFGTKIVKISALNSKIEGLLNEHKNENLVLVGHLLPELSIKLDCVFVVRAKLDALIERLEKRGYAVEKIRENIIAEALDYCGVNSEHLSDQVFEIEGEAGMERALAFIKAHLGGSNTTGLSKKPIDKMSELFALIKDGNKYKF